MKTIITIGCNGMQHEKLFDVLVGAGIQQAAPGKREALSPQALQALMLKANDVDLQRSKLGQVKLGKLWNELATDLFVANLSQSQWGWSDPQSIVFMDFWRGFDSQVRLLLLYNSPQKFLARRLGDGPVSSLEVEALLSEWRLWGGRLASYAERHSEQTLLVNSDSALAEPNRLIELLRLRWGLSLESIASKPQNINSANELCPLQAKLALELIPSDSSSWGVYAKLEAVSALTSHSSGVISSEEAWSLWHGLHKRIQHNNEQLSAEIAKLQRLSAENGSRWTEEKDVLVRQSQALVAEKSQIQKKLDASVLEQSQLQQKLELMKAEQIKAKQALDADIKKYAHREAELKTAMQTVNDNIHKELSAAVNKQEQLRKELEQAKKNASEAEARLQSAQKASGKSDALAFQLKETQEENELLLRQLHEVQEELEQLFLKQQSPTTSALTAGSNLATSFWRQHQPTEVVVDLRQDMVGTCLNWYEGEVDGRWAGPQSPASIELPAFKPGVYEVEYLVVDAMSPEVLNELSVQVLDQVVPLKIERPLTGHPFPVKAKGKISLGEPIQSKPWELALNFALTISPAESGSDDARRLSVRVQHVLLRRMKSGD